MSIPAERIRTLAKELSEALEEWIHTEMEGEAWAIRIYPASIKEGHGVYLENISFCAPVLHVRDTPTHRHLDLGGAE